MSFMSINMRVYCVNHRVQQFPATKTMLNIFCVCTFSWWWGLRTSV